MRRRLREIYLRPRHVARSRPARKLRLIGDEARASKLQLKLSVSIRAHGKVRDTGSREKANYSKVRIFESIKISDKKMRSRRKNRSQFHFLNQFVTI